MTNRLPGASAQAGSARDRTGGSAGAFTAWVGAQFADGRVERISPADGFYYQGCVRPNGTAALFSGAAAGPPRLWLAELDPLGEPHPVTPPDSGARHGVWSWDSERIAFTSDRAAGAGSQTVEAMTAQGQPDAGDIFVMVPGAEAALQLTQGPSIDQRPTFSPDGKTIVFVSNRDNRTGFWSVPSDGSGEPQPLPYRGFGYRPWFSVDGVTLYFFTVDGERHRLAAVDIEGEDAVLLNNDDKGWTHGPFCDPNGQVLIVHSTRVDGRYRLFEVPLDGAEMCEIKVEGVDHPMHGTRSQNGTLVFDVAS